MNHFHHNGLTTTARRSSAVGPHSGDPHYATTPADTPIRQGDFVLVDLWAKLDRLEPSTAT